jgi:N,N'-diacetyllegionaminate synthase
MKKLQNIKIGKHVIGPGKPVFIIAEAGVNHNGSLALAKKLIDAAKNTGADAVKFQTFNAEEVVTAKGSMASYQKRNTGKTESQLTMLKRLELTDKEFATLSAYAKKRGIIFFSTPHGGFTSVDLLEKLRVPLYKVGSADLTNLPLIQYIAQTKKPIIISSGLGTLSEIKEAVAIIRKTGNNKIVVFQCTTDYPAALAEINMRAMKTIEQATNAIIGFSDHTVGSEASVVAVASGAAVLEKHLTLSNSMQGPDHKASLNPKDFTQYVRDVRTAELIMGSSFKTPTKSSKQYIPLVLKSVVAARPIKKGERFSRKNLAIKRPAGGLPPKSYFAIEGKRATRDIARDEFIRTRDYK